MSSMKASLCVKTLENACLHYPELRNAIIHSDRGSQYTSKEYREAIRQYEIRQSMNSDGGRCHDNVRCESIWARMELGITHQKKVLSYTEMELKIRDHIAYYRTKRIQARLAYRAPQEVLLEYQAALT